MTTPMNARRRQTTRAMVCEAIDPHLVVPTPRGDLIFSFPTGRSSNDPVNFYTGEPETIRWIESIPEGAVLWDIGANVGTYTLYAAFIRGLRVIAFEPSAATYANLCDNLHRNGVDSRVDAYCVALSDRVGLDRLYMADAAAGHSMRAFGQTMTVNGPIKNPVTQTVPGFTIDRFMELFAPPPPTHIKLDVDSIEERILAGGADTLRRHTRQIMVEIADTTWTPGEAAIRTVLAGLGLAEDKAFHRPGDIRNVLFRRDS